MTEPGKDSGARRSRLADDVAYYLALTPRQLPSRYLYDELGSSLFEAICRLPWYRITSTERQLLRTRGAEILALVSPIDNIVELGPGSGEKLMTLLMTSPRRDARVHLVDISAAALTKAAAALAGAALTVVPHQATYEDGLAAIRRGQSTGGRTLVAFLGSNIGNFDPPGVDAFLRSVRSTLCPGDAFLLGTDLMKPEDELLIAYDDPLGVTAAFNRNLLVRVNRELGADFDVEAFGHQALWNASLARIEMHLVSRMRQRVRVPASELDIMFEPGERIWTESSYKYRVGEIAPLLGRAGFAVTAQWTEGTYALTLATAQ